MKALVNFAKWGMECMVRLSAMLSPGQISSFDAIRPFNRRGCYCSCKPLGLVEINGGLAMIGRSSGLGPALSLPYGQ